MFLDAKTLGNGELPRHIFSQIDARAHFVTLLSHGTLNQVGEPEDWVRREIEYAIGADRNVVPVLVAPFVFNDARPFLITDKLKQLENFTGLTLPMDYFPEAMVKLANMLQPPKYIVIKPLSQQEQNEAVDFLKGRGTAAPITDAVLRAHALFLEGLRIQETSGDLRNLQSAIQAYTEAIELKPDYYEAYANRSLARAYIGDAEGAIDDADKALSIEPNFVVARCNLGVAWANKDALEGAIYHYNKALELNATDLDTYYHRAEAYFALQRYTEAFADFDKAIKLKPQPIEPRIIAGLAISHFALGQKAKAIDLWRWLLTVSANYGDSTWVQKELKWFQPLVDTAQRLIEELETP